MQEVDEEEVNQGSQDQQDQHSITNHPPSSSSPLVTEQEIHPIPSSHATNSSNTPPIIDSVSENAPNQSAEGMSSLEERKEIDGDQNELVRAVEGEESKGPTASSLEAEGDERADAMPSTEVPILDQVDDSGHAVGNGEVLPSETELTDGVLKFESLEKKIEEPHDDIVEEVPSAIDHNFLVGSSGTEPTASVIIDQQSADTTVIDGIEKTDEEKEKGDNITDEAINTDVQEILNPQAIEVQHSDPIDQSVALNVEEASTDPVEEVGTHPVEEASTHPVDQSTVLNVDNSTNQSAVLNVENPLDQSVASNDDDPLDPPAASNVDNPVDQSVTSDIQTSAADPVNQSATSHVDALAEKDEAEDSLAIPSERSTIEQVELAPQASGENIRLPQDSILDEENATQIKPLEEDATKDVPMEILESKETGLTEAEVVPPEALTTSEALVQDTGLQSSEPTIATNEKDSDHTEQSGAIIEENAGENLNVSDKAENDDTKTNSDNVEKQDGEARENLNVNDKAENDDTKTNSDNVEKQDEEAAPASSSTALEGDKGKDDLPEAPPNESDLQSDEPDPKTADQIAILLKINKELIRLCIDLQSKELTNDLIYKESAMRLQSNLSFLANLAEPGKQEKAAVALNVEPFPINSLSSETLLPKLYAHLRSLSTSSSLSINSVSQDKQVETTATLRTPEAQAESEKVTTQTNSSIQSETQSDQAIQRTPPTSGNKKRRRTSTVDQDAQSNRAAPGRTAEKAAATPKTNRRKSSTTALPTSSTSSTVPATTAAAPSNAVPPSNPMPNPLPNGFPNQNGVLAHSAPSPASALSAASPQTNAIRPPTGGNPTPQQLQGLTQAFGQNAVNNLNALQAHYRAGQNQAIVSYMEANVPNFRTLPLQTQLQQMASVQNAAMQRQRQASIGSNVSNSAASPGGSGQVSTPQQQARQVSNTQQPQQQRRPSAAPSPGLQQGAEHLRRNTQSPMAAPAIPFQHGGAVNGTPVNMSMPFGNVASPAASAASPGSFGQNNMMQSQQQQTQQNSLPNQFAASMQRNAAGSGQPNFSFPSQQQQQQPGGMMATSQAQQLLTSLPAQLSSLPAHLQQQLLQNLLMQQQQQQQSPSSLPQMTSQPMAPPMGINPMMANMFGQQQGMSQLPGSPANVMSGFRPAGVGAGMPGTPGMPNLATMWANLQQQQQQNNNNNSQ